MMGLSNFRLMLLAHMELVAGSDGFQEEEYVLQDGAWLIDVMRLARLRMDELDQARPAIKPGRLAPNPEWL